uniref:Immunoglobulin V-set domain-containing protein n=1 Tax=Sander lucioperca TaxID=283035 RepID=A0A8C9ZPJ4_SANLU
MDLLQHEITELSLPLGISCDELTPVETEKNSLEGSSVTLSYRYLKLSTSNYFFWYQQYPGKPPEFIIFHSGTQNEINSGLPVSVSEDKTKMVLQISSAAVTDSALYYCAVRPTVTANPQSLYKNTS